MFNNPTTLDQLIEDYINSGLKVFKQGILPNIEDFKDEQS